MSEKYMWQEEATEMVNNILDFKEKIKNTQMDLDSEKIRLTELLEEHSQTEFICNDGKANFVDFQRVGLIKEEVESTVDGVNKGKIKSINMNDLTKDIKVHFLNVRGKA